MVHDFDQIAKRLKEKGDQKKRKMKEQQAKMKQIVI